MDWSEAVCKILVQCKLYDGLRCENKVQVKMAGGMLSSTVKPTEAQSHEVDKSSQEA